MRTSDELTTREYWENSHTVSPKLRLPSSLLVSTRNLNRLLRREIRAGMEVLEIGCAPGKHLVWVTKVLGARTACVDYSRRGMEFARKLFDVLGVEGDLRCENVFSTTFSPEQFDVVYSVGVIEHFKDPRPIVRKHVELLKPGGKALLVIPHYGGVYGRFQQYFDPENLKIHNTDIMTVSKLADLAPRDLSGEVTAAAMGRISPWLISFEKKWPRVLAHAVRLCTNAVGLLQPFDIRPLCPFLVLSIVRKNQVLA